MLQANLLLGPPSTVVAQSIGVTKGHVFMPNVTYLTLADIGLPPLHKHLVIIFQGLPMVGGGENFDI